ncbi:MAG TPA: hypothetical protein VJ894_02175 [Cryomorphaceae bacterium]|nr:hypothetical protein [Cryomorphaceae bacterium]
MGKKPIKYANFEPHHKQRNFTVFYFYAKDHADYFEALLIENEIPFERGSGQDMVRRHLIGLHRTHQEKAEILNNEVGNYYRKPFLGTNSLRNFVLIFTLIVIVLALVGYYLRLNK